MNFHEMWTKTKSTKSKIEKEEIIKTFFLSQHDSEEIMYLKCYLDPDFTANFSKAMIEKAKKVDIVARESKREDVCSVLFMLNSKEITGNTAISFVGSMFTVWSEEEKENFKVIATKESLGFSLQSINDIHRLLYDCNFIDVFECQLAEKYEPASSHRYNKNFYESVKLDGLRSLFYDDKFHTRNNKTMIGFEFIADEVIQITKKFHIDFVDGEFFSTEISFEEIQGAVMSSVNIDDDVKKKIKFNIFAVTNDEVLKNKTSYMINLLHEIEVFCELNEFKYINVLKQSLIVNDSNIIKSKCEDYMREGFEGIMLRDTEIPYDFKRSRALMKFKLFQEDDFICKGIIEGEGDLVGMLGAIVVESKDGEVVSKVGTGFKDSQREEFFNDPLKIVGKIVEIKFQGLTDNSLRFPVFKCVKEDR